MIETKIMTLQDHIIHLMKNEDGQFITHPFLQNLKSKGLNTFSQKGFPTIKNEEYKYTPVHSFTKEMYQIPAISHTDNAGYVLDANDILQIHLNDIHQDIKGENKGAYRIVFFNGNFVKELSYLPDHKLVQISPFSEMNVSIGNLGKLSENTYDAFASINNALANDGMCIHIQKNAIVDLPIHIIHLTKNESNLWLNPRLYIHAESNSQVEIIETYYHTGNGKLVSNLLSEVHLEANTILHHYDIQKSVETCSGVKNTFTHLAQDAQYSNYTFNLPGVKFWRNNSDIHVKGKNVNSELFGLVIAKENQLIDNHTAVHHEVPNTESHQLYKGIVMDNANLVFNGKIFVYQDAQKTNAFQQSNNLTLSPNATVNAKPQLEIFADDVKCSHGSTIGQLDNNAMFYLKSRGIGQESAKKMMIGAFAYDVTEKVKNSTVKHYVEQQIANALD